MNSYCTGTWPVLATVRTRVMDSLNETWSKMNSVLSTLTCKANVKSQWSTRSQRSRYNYSLVVFTLWLLFSSNSSDHIIDLLMSFRYSTRKRLNEGPGVEIRFRACRASSWPPRRSCDNGLCRWSWCHSRAQHWPVCGRSFAASDGCGSLLRTRARLSRGCGHTRPERGSSHSYPSCPSQDRICTMAGTGSLLPINNQSLFHRAYFTHFILVSTLHLFDHPFSFIYYVTFPYLMLSNST